MCARTASRGVPARVHARTLAAHGLPCASWCVANEQCWWQTVTVGYEQHRTVNAIKFRWNDKLKKRQTEHAPCAPSSSPNRPQSAAMAAARAPSSPPRGRPGGTSAHGSRQRGGGFAALNIKRSPSASSRASGPHRSPPRGGDGGCAGSSGRRDASFSARKRPKVQIRYDTSGQDHGSFPSLQRSCVVQPFGLIKPSSPGAP